MPSAAFTSALRFVLRWEGGFIDHRQDPGGRTNKGITQKVYDAWRRRHGLTATDVKVIDDDEVRAIYEFEYWLPPRCDLLADPLPLVQFDTAVNMGVRRAVRFLQAAVGCAVDGHFGPRTLQAVRACDPAAVTPRYCDLRESFYRALTEKNTELELFLKGWLNRLNALRGKAGVPGFEGAKRGVDFGDAGYIGRIPDFGESGELDL